MFREFLIIVVLLICYTVTCEVLVTVLLKDLRKGPSKAMILYHYSF